jgi:hypothetical protein
MAVEFEEENFNFNTQNTAQSRYEARVNEVNTPFMKVVMVFFALLCVAGAFYFPTLINPKNNNTVVYVEDLTEARMRLIPANQVNSIVSKLPSRTAQ